MMSSDAYSDFHVRMRSIISMIRTAEVASDDGNASLSSLLSAGICVLLTAAFERYCNDVLEERSQQLLSTQYSLLEDGVRLFLCAQIIDRINRDFNNTDINRNNFEKSEKKMLKLHDDISRMRANASDWQGYTRFGIFGDGSVSAQQLEAKVMMFRPDKKFIDYVEEKGENRASFVRNLDAMVSARHGVAHALPGVAQPSVSDVKTWFAATRRTARHVDRYIFSTV